MQIDISSLDVGIKSQLPISLQLSTDSILLTDLPPYIQYLITEYKTKAEVSTPYTPTNIIDISFEKSVYNDVKVLSTKRAAIIEYIYNYLLTPKGSYPFDPSFGTDLKKHLQTKDTSLRKVLLDNELKSFVDVIRSSFSTNITVTGSRLTPINSSDRVDYLMEINFMIDEVVVTFALK